MMKESFVPESFAKKNERNQKEAAELQKNRDERRKQIKAKREEWRAKGKKYHDAEKTREQNLVNEKRLARNSGNFYVPAEAKVAFVMRIKGINHINPTVKKILRLFRLRQLNNGVFLRINKATSNMLKRIEPFVTYGYPNRKTVSELIYKRGHGKINRCRIPLTDNLIVEQNLGKFGITCVEDLVEEIYQVGPHFKEANNFLWPFKLNNPRGGWKNKNHSYHNNGVWGNREEEINDLVRSMN